MNRFMLLMFLFLTGCATSDAGPIERNSVTAIAEHYFAVYAERKDFERFIQFYAEDAQLTDVVYGNSVQGRNNIATFFNWSAGDFAAVNPGAILEVHQQVVSGDLIVTSGVFLPFRYAGKELGPWEFTIWLELDEQGKIIKQQDWINYSPKKITIWE